MGKKKHIIGFNIFVILLAIVYVVIIVLFNVNVKKASVAVVEGSYGEQFAFDNELEIIELADSEEALLDYRYETDEIPFVYNMKDETIEIIKYEGKDDIIVIPSYVAEKPVTAIAMDTYNISKVIVIPETITEITGEFSKVIYSSAFFVELVFTILAFIVSLVLINILLPRYNKGKEEYLLTGNQMIMIAFYVLAQTAFAIIVTRFWWVSAIVAFLVSLVILIIFVAVFMLAGAGRTQVKEVNAKVAENTSRMKALRDASKNLADDVKDAALRKKVQRLADEIRFSDAVSNENLVELEQQIEKLLSALKEAVLAGDDERISNLTDKAMDVLQERNKRCKAGK